MSRNKEFLCCLFLSAVILTVNGDSNFAGAAVTSDSSGTRSVLVSGKNGAAGVGVYSPRIGVPVPAPGVRVGSGYGGGAFASAGTGGASASAGPTGAYAGPGGAYAGPGPWGYPYWNAPDYYDDAFAYGGNRYGSGGGVGVYSSSDSNGISTRFANLGPGGQATIIEQNGNEPPRVYNYRGVNKPVVSDDFDN